MRGRTGHQIWHGLDGDFLVRLMALDHLENCWHLCERNVVKYEAEYRAHESASGGRLAAPRRASVDKARHNARWVQAFAREMARRGR